jgi:hypothetical protein
MLTAVKERMDSLVAELDEARKPKMMRRTPVRNKQGIIQYVDESPIEV